MGFFTSDDKWIVFSHEEPAQNNLHIGIEKNWALYRVAPDKSHQDKEYSAPQKLLPTLAQPERISPFPDGKRVLVSYADNDDANKTPPEIFDIEAKTRTTLRLPKLFDADLPTGKPLVPREIAVSPDGKQLAFSALRSSGKSEDDDAILIYTCNINGTNLKRVTPPQNVALVPYQYPQEGVTGLNACEKLQPKPNVGVPFDAGNPEAIQKLIEGFRKQEQEARAKAEKQMAEKKIAEKSKTAQPVVP